MTRPIWKICPQLASTMSTTALCDAYIRLRVLYDQRDRDTADKSYNWAEDVLLVRLGRARVATACELQCRGVELPSRALVSGLEVRM